MQSIA